MAGNSKMKMHDIGETLDTPTMARASKEKYYSSISVDVKDFPALAKKKVGTNCRVYAEIRIKGVREKRGGATEIELEFRKLGVAR